VTAGNRSIASVDALRGVAGSALFCFLVHLPVIHPLTIPAALLRYGHAGFLLNPLPSMRGDIRLYRRIMVRDLALCMFCGPRW
jgi:hypothetical protein